MFVKFKQQYTVLHLQAPAHLKVLINIASRNQFNWMLTGVKRLLEYPIPVEIQLLDLNIADEEVTLTCVKYYSKSQDYENSYKGK